ncbi:MAG: TIGR02266 family protein, partial [Myxococcaceae bacterium]
MTGEAKLIPLRIRLPYGSEEEFVERYGGNVARGGVFIATRSQKPEGTGIAFEFVLKDGTRLLRGEGVVQKSHGEEAGARSGMTVRFTRLDSRSKALIDRIVAQRGGAGPAVPPEPPSVPEPAAPAVSADTPSKGHPTAPAGDGVPPVPGPSEHASAAARRQRPPSAPAFQPASSPPGAEVVLGIDLGTTNSRVAIVQDGVARLVSLGTDGRTFAIPSVVALDEKGRFLVGARAKAQVLADPQNTVYGAKRLMGRRARSRKIRELSKRFPYAIVADMEGDAGVELRGRVFSLPEIAAMLLKELKESVQNQLGREISRAVLCVPAYFNDHQRAAMLDAGKLAGLDVLRLLNEPSAVALAFGHGRGLARKRILVYDLGGGTFDASVVELTGDDLEVVTTGGDNFLGGLDFDVRLAQQLSLKLPEEVRARVDESQLSAQRILDAAEQAKIALSDVESCPVRVPYALTRDDGSPVDLDAVVTRVGLEEVTADLVERTIEVTSAVLEAGGLKPQGLDEVLLVGGQSRAPLVRRRIEEVLGKRVRADVDPHGAVAMGAA